MYLWLPRVWCVFGAFFLTCGANVFACEGVVCAYPPWGSPRGCLGPLPLRSGSRAVYGSEKSFKSCLFWVFLVVFCLVRSRLFSDSLREHEAGSMLPAGQQVGVRELRPFGSCTVLRLERRRSAAHSEALHQTVKNQGSKPLPALPQEQLASVSKALTSHR